MTFERKKNTKALLWTAGIHVLLLLAFLLLKYTLPAQPAVEELGMEVNLGTSDNGSGDDQPESPEDPAAVAADASGASSSDNSSEKDIHTSDDADAPSIAMRRPNENRRPNPQPVPNPATNRNNTRTNTNNTARTNTPPQSPRYVYPGSTGKAGNNGQNNRPGSNEGNGQGAGDMGVPAGSVGAANYNGVPGSGGGTAITSSISGRSIVSRPDPKAEFREGGRVVIRVTVNRDGAITDSRVVSAANATIRALALKKLQGVRFNKSTSAPAEQFGNITFEFRTTRK